ncbi:hypothetical protein DPMN_133779 [Dreissena polymorpha]|uniref:Uncharacterized protein n=1 Tax=Dreissena polymorpha TaxID=45954 RepID=A0A9D4JA38_DREPO|nr:hypothetical protein DPMN_133779 [Dreissena polymorpha]
MDRLMVLGWSVISPAFLISISTLRRSILRAATLTCCTPSISQSLVFTLSSRGTI